MGLPDKALVEAVKLGVETPLGKELAAAGGRLLEETLGSSEGIARHLGLTVKGAESPEPQLRQLESILTSPSEINDPLSRKAAESLSQVAAEGFLRRNPGIGSSLSTQQWATSHASEQVRQFVESQGRQTGERWQDLNLHYRNLLRSVGLTGEDLRRAAKAPVDLAQRSERDLITPAQREQTLRNSIELLEIAAANRTKAGTLDRAGRLFRTAAVQTMQQAGDPFLVVQGEGRSSCGLANLQFRTYLRQPDQATRLVSEVLRTGQFQTMDHSVIKLNTLMLKPMPNSLHLLRPSGRDSKVPRDYAAQIFQLTGANMHWQREVKIAGRAVPKGSIRYDGTASGYRLIDYSGENPVVLNRFAPVTHDQLAEVGEQIAGKATRPNIIPFDSDVLRNQKSFYNHLKSLNYPEDFPVFVGVHGEALQHHMAFFRIRATKMDHSISILSPEPTGGLIRIKNSWYAGVDERIPTSTLFSLIPRLVSKDGRWVASRSLPALS